MKSKPLPPWLAAIAMGLIAILSTSCNYPLSDDCSDEYLASKKEQLAARRAELAKFTAKNPSGALSSGGLVALGAAAAAHDIRLALVAGPPSQFPQFLDLPHLSSGKFTVQMTVAVSEIAGLAPGNTAAGLLFTQPQFPGGRHFFLAALYGPSSGPDGMKAYVGDVNGYRILDPANTSIIYPDNREIDLRMEQTDTQIIFSSRATPTDQAAGGWTPMYVLDVAPHPAPFTVSLGMMRVQKGGRYYFSNIAMDGDAVGGTAEKPIIDELRTSIEANRSAQTHITAATPDLPGALADADLAIDAQVRAWKLLTTAFVDRSLQSPKGGLLAEKTMRLLHKDLTTVRTALALQDAKKAKAQLTKLDQVAGGQLATVANLHGIKATNLKNLPEKLFSLRIP